MANKRKKAHPRKAVKTRTTTARKRKKKLVPWRRIFIIGLLALALIGFIISSIPRGQKNKGPKFMKEGTLQFVNTNNDVIKKIDIEVADDDYQRMQGLMFRREMKESQGMLFLMEQLKPQSFWMRNTYISLDIIYVNDKKQIVSIQKNTTPLSDAPLPSGKPALYVVEVVSGFCDKYGVGVGDIIDFEL